VLYKQPLSSHRSFFPSSSSFLTRKTFPPLSLPAVSTLVYSQSYLTKTLVTKPHSALRSIKPSTLSLTPSVNPSSSTRYCTVPCPSPLRHHPGCFPSPGLTFSNIGPQATFLGPFVFPQFFNLGTLEHDVDFNQPFQWRHWR
jgi:hypothetical protein